MDFKDKRPIYVQIADRISDNIIRGIHAPDTRIPSVRDYSAMLEVNINTVMRSFELLQRQEVIYNKRGLGYFVSADAHERIAAARHERFITEDVPQFFEQADLLGITADELRKMYETYKSKKDINDDRRD